MVPEEDNAEVQFAALPALGSAWIQLGKAEARQEFLKLVDQAERNNQMVAVTDRGKPVAVILNYKQAVLLAAQLKKQRSAKKPNLQGSIVQVGNLERSRRSSVAALKRAAKQTADSL